MQNLERGSAYPYVHWETQVPVLFCIKVPLGHTNTHSLDELSANVWKGALGQYLTQLLEE